MSRMVLENRPHAVAGKGGGELCIVTEAFDEVAGRVDVVEPAVERADPEASLLILDHGRDLFARQSAAILAKVQECVAFGLPAIESRRRPNPHPAAAIEREGEDLIVAQRIGVLRVVPPMLDPAGRGVEDIDAGIVHSYPDAAAR